MRRLGAFFFCVLCLGAQTVEQLRVGFEHPPDDARILMRWWWFGPSVRAERLEAEMRRMKEGGIGGFEIQPVYPLALDDPAKGVRNYRYLSPEFLEMIRFTARQARELGLRMDVTLGSGWPFGGPHIPLDLAAGKLRSERRAVLPGASRLARPTPYEGERLMAALVAEGSIQETDPRTFRLLDLSGAGPIPLPPAAGPRTAVFYFSSHTGQVVKRAAYGAEGYVLDHYNRRAIEVHLQEVGDKLLAAAGPGGIHAVFCDSLEVYEADWTPDLPQEFRKRRGYDLLPVLPLLEYEAGERSAEIRRDFGRTLSELYEERFLRPMHEWAQKNRVQLRIQNYGLPPATLSSHRHADLFDGEGWHWRTLASTRWASSASHLFRKPVAASETWTWIHSPAFRATPLDIKAEADQHFLAGINQLIGHGWPYSPPEAGTPGWAFYAAGVFTPQNPWWPVMPDLALYLQRVSFLLRQGEPVADVALYAPAEDAWASFWPGTPGNLDLWRRIRDRIGPELVAAVLDAGYSFDLIDDGTLEEAGNRYKALLLPAVRSMPEATRRWLADYAAKGGTVVKAEEGLGGLPRQLAAAAPPDVAVSPATPDIGFVHRRLADGDLYFVANAGNQPRRVRARFRARSPYAELWDPLTGRAERLVSTNGEAVLDFEPYGSHVVVFAKSGSAPEPRPGSESAAEELRTGWSLSFAGNPGTRPVELPHSWSSDPATQHFSGIATYRREWRPGPAFRASGTRVFLDFGPAPAGMPNPDLERSPRAAQAFFARVSPPIREAAAVFVNGRRAGTLWKPPYRLEITDLLRDGANEFRVEVYNTAINHLAGPGIRIDEKALTERYGLRFRMQEMDNLRPLPSGILSVPRVVGER